MGDVIEMRRKAPPDPADLALSRALFRAQMSLLSSALHLLTLQLHGLAKALDEQAKK
ncbi:hypothetical protein ACRQ5Q_15040 [Bradyrhizobium sp. PMVTL-01]|uniref:hypothetical protein n=1 Tax=Bradyrhizobium sp. PMVTL-01 TaxID=3434999 RepID=UPI003F7264F6